MNIKKDKTINVFGNPSIKSIVKIIDSMPVVENQYKELYIVNPNKLKTLLQQELAPYKNFINANNFSGLEGELLLLHNDKGLTYKAIIGLGGNNLESPWTYSRLLEILPSGGWKLCGSFSLHQSSMALLGSILERYNFKNKGNIFKKHLYLPKHRDCSDIFHQAAAIYFGRDLINLPASDLNTEALEKICRDFAVFHKANIKIISGDSLIKNNYPAIYAVGKASISPPRLIDIRWKGKQGGKSICLVGKGVCFDSGGLNIKSSQNMRLMKKDMGGAATVLSLAHMIMRANLPINLRILIPAVENSISENSIRPGDVIHTRSKNTVEVLDTDAEGRLILCDALYEADSEDPDLIVDFATLTGAARVALGTDLPALFSSNDRLTNLILNEGIKTFDPLWNLPLWSPYKSLLKSDIADLANISPGSYGGAITAALFLQHFVKPTTNWAHIDLFAWNLSSTPGRSRGGEVMAARAVFNAIKKIINED